MRQPPQLQPKRPSGRSPLKRLLQAAMDNPLPQERHSPRRFRLDRYHRLRPVERDTPMEIGLARRSAPGVGLRRCEDAFWPAQAGRWPKAYPGRIHSTPLTLQENPRRRSLLQTEPAQVLLVQAEVVPQFMKQCASELGP